MSEFVSVFDIAGESFDAEQTQRAKIQARASADNSLGTFLAQAQSGSEFEHRLALADETIVVAASAHGADPEELRADYRRLHALKMEALGDGGNDETHQVHDKCPDCGGTGAVPAGGGEDPEDVHNGYVSCPTCGGSGRTRRGTKQSVRKQAIGPDHPDFQAIQDRDPDGDETRQKAPTEEDYARHKQWAQQNYPAAAKVYFSSGADKHDTGFYGGGYEPHEGRTGEQEAYDHLGSRKTAGSINDYEFDSPFRVHEDGSHESDSHNTPYVPNVEHHDEHDMLIDGVPHNQHPHWEALTGHTGQYGYNGPVMHPSEYIGGGLEKHIKENPGTYAVTTVESGDEPDESGDRGEPAGWTVLRRKEGRTARRDPFYERLAGIKQALQEGADPLQLVVDQGNQDPYARPSFHADEQVFADESEIPKGESAYSASQQGGQGGGAPTHHNEAPQVRQSAANAPF